MLRIRIRIILKAGSGHVESWIGIKMESWIRVRIRIRVKSRIRLRMKVMRIRNNGCKNVQITFNELLKYPDFGSHHMQMLKARRKNYAEK